MMIRINLLPVRQVKKREMGKQVLVLFAAVILLAGVLNYLWLDNRETELQRGKDAVAATDRQIKELEKVIGEVNQINDRKKELEDKLKVLAELRKGRAGPVKFMDALATATPKQVWVMNFEESGNSVKLRGTALSHEDVADFMRGLTNLVWTPKGMGRLVDSGKRDATTNKVELLGGSATVEDFPVGDVHPFFTDIELRSAAQKPAGPNQTTVEFELTFSANYTV